MSARAPIRPARPEDAAAIAAMLARLGEELDDPAATTQEVILAHGFGPRARFSTLIADADEPVGLALYFAHFSTARGEPGAFVQDLWTAPAARGQGLGARLLAAVARSARRDWSARYLALSVHAHNADAARLYTRLGFAADTVQPMSLAGAGFEALAERDVP